MTVNLYVACVDLKLKSFLPQVHSLLKESNCAFYFHWRRGVNTFVKFHCTYWRNRKPYKFSHWLGLDVGFCLYKNCAPRLRSVSFAFRLSLKSLHICQPRVFLRQSRGQLIELNVTLHLNSPNCLGVKTFTVRTVSFTMTSYGHRFDKFQFPDPFATFLRVQFWRMFLSHRYEFLFSCENGPSCKVLFLKEIRNTNPALRVSGKAE